MSKDECIEKIGKFVNDEYIRAMLNDAVDFDLIANTAYEIALEHFSESEVFQEGYKAALKVDADLLRECRSALMLTPMTTKSAEIIRKLNDRMGY